MNDNNRVCGLMFGSLMLLGAASAASGNAAAATSACPADPAWFNTPAMPSEVKRSGSDGTSNFCDFYQFSWQAFAYLMAPSKANPALRNFEDVAQFPELRVAADAAATPLNSCDGSRRGQSLFVRNIKADDAGSTFVIPERIGQAGGGATIYDQQGNVVYYDVRFGRSLCDIPTIDANANFPGGTTELKLAWKVLTKSDDPSGYITMDATIGTQKTPTTLGLIGFHLAVATPDHPEFVWATFEHKTNVPDCSSPSAIDGWSFTSAQCATALQKQDQPAIKACNFNKAAAQTDPTKVSGQPPTEICRVNPYGSAASDPKHAENVADIVALNTGVRPYLVDGFSTLTNYFNVGALWLSDPSQDSTIANQRGSLRLANSVAETDFQNVDTSASFVSNCFGCHNYKGTANPATGKNTTAGSLSHIFDDIVIGSGACIDVQSATLINSQAGVGDNCTKACASSSSGLKWNGQWTNTSATTGEQLPMTVCGCCGPKAN
jgi:hypothetical protein